MGLGEQRHRGKQNEERKREREERGKINRDEGGKERGRG